MTNNTITRQIDDTTYTLTLPDDDRACLRIALELQRDASHALLDAALRDLDADNPYSIDAETPLTQFDYIGDHDDYNTAAAMIATAITHAICAHTTATARDMLIELFNDDDNFLIDLETADFNHTFPLEIDY